MSNRIDCPECEKYGTINLEEDIPSCSDCGYVHEDDEWLSFKELPPMPKTRVFEVWSKDQQNHKGLGAPKLGEIKWYAQWRHYCFFPNTFIDTVHSDRCLLSISKFITRLNQDHKNKLARRKKENGNGKAS